MILLPGALFTAGTETGTFICAFGCKALLSNGVIDWTGTGVWDIWKEKYNKILIFMVKR